MKASDRKDGLSLNRILTERSPPGDIYSIMYRHKHFKHGFKAWLVYLVDLCSLVWHLKFNIFVYVKTKQVTVCFLFPLTDFEIMNTHLYIRRSFYSFFYPLTLTSKSVDQSSMKPALSINYLSVWIRVMLEPYILTNTLIKL
jgi:hypothetical protein